MDSYIGIYSCWLINYKMHVLGIMMIENSTKLIDRWSSSQVSTVSSTTQIYVELSPLNHEPFNINYEAILEVEFLVYAY